MTSTTMNPWYEDKSSSFTPASSTTSTSAMNTTVEVNITLTPEGSAHAPAPTPKGGKRIKTWWSNDRIICTCSNIAWLCRHIYEYLLDGEDVGKHTVISSTTKDKIFKRWLPLTNDAIVEFDFQVMEHPANPGDFVIYAAETERLSLGVSMILGKDDGLLPLVNALRDRYRYSNGYQVCLDKIIDKKRLPCPRVKHARANDQDLVDRIRRALVLIEPKGGPEETDIRRVAEEIALAEAYHLHVHKMCLSCYSYTGVDPLDIPDL